MKGGEGDTMSRFVRHATGSSHGSAQPRPPSTRHGLLGGRSFAEPRSEQALVVCRSRLARVGGVVTAGMAATVVLATAGLSWSEDALTAKLHPSGMVEVSRGKVSLGTIDLNAHGAGWEYASQKDSKAKISDLPGKAGKRAEGVFAIPDTDGGAIRYTQSVRMLPRGFRIEYDLTTEKTMRLNGLQVSISLPEAQYAGKEVLISQLGNDPTLVGLPKEHQEGRSQVWTGEGAKIEVAKDTAEAVTVTLLAVTDVLVQDLRQWESPLFEIRFPAITDPSGREVLAGARFHLDITVTFASPVQIVGRSWPQKSVSSTETR